MADDGDTVHYDGPTGGWGSLKGIAETFARELTNPGALETLRRQNKPGGFMCVSCAWGKPAKPTFAGILANLRPGVTEVYVHPVEDGPELRGYDPDHPQIRVDDFALMTDPEVPAMIAAAGATLISFAPLRDLQRAG